MKLTIKYIVIIALLYALYACTVIPIKNAFENTTYGKVTSSAVITSGENMDKHINVLTGKMK